MPHPFTDEELIKLRRELHRTPEISGSEEQTVEIVLNRLKQCSPDALYTGLGGHGILASFISDAGDAAPSILFRAELDAIPVREKADRPYRSENEGVMHGCGHDGHMTILIALASEIGKTRPQGIHVHLLFQPAEETGEGAGRVLSEPVFDDIQVDIGFALHNLPGFEEGAVILKPGVFAVASCGLEIELNGESSHAAEPEKGLNPSSAVADIMLRMRDETEPFLNESPTHRVACTYIQMGERAFGVSPGHAEIGYTFRSDSDSKLEEAISGAEKWLDEMNRKSELEITTRRAEPFHSTVNDPEGVECLRQACNRLGIAYRELDHPFLWSEDFGRFGTHFPVVLFGLGAGAESEPLHSSKYDFNEGLIQTGSRLFKGIIETYSRL